MINIQPVVVVYNTSCDNSISVKGLLGQNLKPMIVDNSTKDYGNREYCDRMDLKYLPMGGNAGLSKAYNRALSQISETVDYILWMDDDTEIPTDYLALLLPYVENHPGYDLYIPLVQTKKKSNGLLSPSILDHYYTKRVHSVEEIGGRMFSAINSGLLVKREVYDRYSYDENLFLDCIDHDFMVYCWKMGLRMNIIKEISLMQNFSGEEKPDRKSQLNRFRIFSKDFRYFREKNKCPAASTELILLKRRINILLG